MDKMILDAMKDVPPEEMLKLMSEIALRQTTEMFAKKLTEFSKDPRTLEVDGRTALLAAVAAIYGTNEKLWG